MAIRLAAIQLQEPSLPEALGGIAAASAGGADFALLPETCLGTVEPQAADEPIVLACAQAPLVAASFGRPPARAWRPGQMLGRSCVLGADGLILADADRYPGVITADLDPGQPLLRHDFTRGVEHPLWSDVLADRRPETTDG